jgi:hypothetical protein
MEISFLEFIRISLSKYASSLNHDFAEILQTWMYFQAQEYKYVFIAESQFAPWYGTLTWLLRRNKTVLHRIMKTNSHRKDTLTREQEME